MPLYLEIVTQEKHLLTQEVDQVGVPTVTGEITVLPGHIPLFTKLRDGIVKIKRADHFEEVAIFGGFMDVGPNNRVTILADSAVKAKNISIAKAEQAKRQAEKAMQNKTSEIEFKQAEASLRKALLELKVARRRRQSPETLPQTS